MMGAVDYRGWHLEVARCRRLSPLPAREVYDWTATAGDGWQYYSSPRTYRTERGALLAAMAFVRARI